MKIKRRLLVIFFVLFLTSNTCLMGQVGMGVDLTPSFSGSESKKKSKKKRLKNPFVFHFCKIFDQDYLKIRKLQKKGYGRLELIKVILISRKAQVPLKDIIKDRDKLIPLKKIAKKHKINYRKLRVESAQYKKEIEKKIKEIPVTEEEPRVKKGTKKDEE